MSYWRQYVNLRALLVLSNHLNLTFLTLKLRAYNLPEPHFLWVSLPQAHSNKATGTCFLSLPAGISHPVQNLPPVSEQIRATGFSFSLLSHNRNRSVTCVLAPVISSHPTLSWDKVSHASPLWPGTFCSPHWPKTQGDPLPQHPRAGMLQYWAEMGFSLFCPGWPRTHVHRIFCSVTWIAGTRVFCYLCTVLVLLQVYLTLQFSAVERKNIY